MQIALSAIDANAKRNSRLDLEGIDELAANLKRHGQLQNVLVEPVPNKPGKYLLTAGFRRYAAAKALGWETINAEEMQEGADHRVLNLVENLSREDLKSYDFAMSIKALKEDGMSPKMISAQLTTSNPNAGGVSVKNINNLIRLATNLDKRILKAWREGNPEATTYNLLQIVSEDDQWEQWQFLTGAKVDDSKEEESGEFREPTPKKRRSTEMAKMLKQIEDAQHVAEDDKRLVRATMDWLMGVSPTLCGLSLD